MYLRLAVSVSPNRREAWVDLARHCYSNGDWSECLTAALSALRIKNKPMEYLCESEAWGALPHDLAAIAAYNLGAFSEANFQGMEALKKSPYDDRLSGNLKFYREAAA